MHTSKYFRSQIILTTFLCIIRMFWGCFKLFLSRHCSNIIILLSYINSTCYCNSANSCKSQLKLLILALLLCGIATWFEPSLSYPPGCAADFYTTMGVSEHTELTDSASDLLLSLLSPCHSSSSSPIGFNLPFCSSWSLGCRKATCL